MRYLLLAAILASSGFCQSFPTETQSFIENRWSNIFDEEETESLRLARFTGLIEGMYNIKAPDTWKTIQFRPAHDAFTTLVDEQTSDGGRIVISLTESSKIVKAVVEGAMGEVLWSNNSLDLFPRLFSGNTRLWLDILEDGDQFYVFGRMADARVILVLSKPDGSVIIHHPFNPSRKQHYR